MKKAGNKLNIIGKCSICGGEVIRPTHVVGVSTPYCVQCGAVAINDWSIPIIKTVPNKKQAHKDRGFKVYYG